MKTIDYDPRNGSHIDFECDEIRRIAKERRCLVRMVFNGVRLLAAPKRSARSLRWEWHKLFSEQASKWRQSPQYAAHKCEQEQRRRETQSALDQQMSVLPLATGTLDALMNWLYLFTPLANTSDDVTYNIAATVDAMEAAGYRENAHVGLAPNDFTTRCVLGGYIAGQAINCLRAGLPPHPVLCGFIEQYFELPEDADIQVRESPQST